jgi:hypothetical protein
MERLGKRTNLLRDLESLRILNASASGVGVKASGLRKEETASCQAENV